VRLEPPEAPELPEQGFSSLEGGYLPPAEDPSTVSVEVKEKSDRLQLLQPFPPWNGKDLVDLLVLAKVSGKCTTDHISPAGPWLRYRGHLEKISDNLLLGATNAFTGERGAGTDLLTGERGIPLPELARRYSQAGRSWVVIGDVNYGEGSSREHAAMEPRFRGGRAIVARSFARIHETNLKKQGLLPLTFTDPDDYDRIREDDRVELVGLADLAPGRPVTMLVRHADGSEETMELKHTLSAEQLEYFRAGSALNLLSQRGRAAGGS
jgi:aconitate hydratase